MKKLIIISISLLLLAGCTVINNEEKPSEEQVVEEVNTKFEFTNAVCLRGKAKVEYSKLNRDDEITIIDEDDDFYYFDNSGLTLAIDKNYVRTENESAFEEYTGYCYSGAEVFSDFGLKNKIADLYKNDEIEVIDQVGKVLLVNYEGQLNYMYASDVSDSYIVTYVKPKPVETYTGGGVSTGGGGGGSYTPPVTPAPSGGSDEVEVPTSSLAFIVNENKTEYVPNESYASIQGKVLVDGTVTYITYCSRYEDVKVLDYDEDYATLLIHGFAGKIKREYLRLDGEEDYESWHGYAYSGAEVFYDYELTDEMDWFYKNDDVYVIDEIDGIYVVELPNGTYGYMSADDVSETKLSTYVAPKPVETYTGGGGGGGSYTPVTPAPVEEYSIPML